MASEIAHLLTPPPEDTRVLGPAEAPVPRLKNEYRCQLLVKCRSRRTLNKLLGDLRAYALDRKWNATALVIDVDPLTLL
jgi:primosomal protein N' (replication factor Y)